VADRKDGDQFYQVTAIDADAEYPGDTLKYLTLPNSDEPRSFDGSAKAQGAMTDWLRELRGAWWVEVERMTWRLESDDDLTWWESERDYDYEGAQGWWNHDDDKPMVDRAVTA